MPKRESRALPGNCRFRYSPMKALPGRPVGASPLGASLLEASPRRYRLEDIASKMSLRRFRFKAVASLWLAFFSLQGRSLQDPLLAGSLLEGSQSTCAPSGDRPGARAAFRRQHSGVCAFAHRVPGSSRAGLIACRAHRISGLSRVGRRLWSGMHPATGRNRQLDVPLPSVSRFSRCPASLGVPLLSVSRFSRCPASNATFGALSGRLRNLTGFSAKFALRPWFPLGRGAQAALPSRLAFCGAAFCGAAFRGAISRRAVSRLF
jgi:hypothetical protein